jgi:WD40 repeat protein
VGEIHLSNFDQKLFSVKTPGIFDLDLISKTRFIAGDVEKGLSLWNINKEDHEVNQLFRTELDEKIIYVDHHKLTEEDNSGSVNVAVTMEQGYTTYLKLDEEGGEFKQLHQWKDATNTIWACRLLKDGTTLASGGDFGKYYFYDLRTKLKTMTNTQ